MKAYKLKTSDNVNIAVNFFQNGFDEVIIISPGWCMTKDSKAFMQISEYFSKYFDVINLDFRGHGKSGGFFTFTAKELLDLDAVVEFAKTYNYKKINLMGFSLGAATSLIYSSQHSLINKVIAVSPPSDFLKIENQMWRKEAWGETFRKFEITRFASIRPYPLPISKIKPIEIVDKIKSPTLFIAGEKDPTVHSWHTEVLYKKTLCEKKYHLFENGYHAEDLFLHFKDEFCSICLEWLETKVSTLI